VAGGAQGDCGNRRVPRPTKLERDGHRPGLRPSKSAFGQPRQRLLGHFAALQGAALLPGITNLLLQRAALHGRRLGMVFQPLVGVFMAQKVALADFADPFLRSTRSLLSLQAGEKLRVHGGDPIAPGLNTAGVAW